jgi:hypothetical protein
VDASYDPVAWLGRKILKRRKSTPAEAEADAPSTGPAAVQPEGGVHGIPAPEHADDALVGAWATDAAPGGDAPAEDAPAE